MSASRVQSDADDGRGGLPVGCGSTDAQFSAGGGGVFLAGYEVDRLSGDDQAGRVVRDVRGAAEVAGGSDRGDRDAGADHASGVLEFVWVFFPGWSVADFFVYGRAVRGAGERAERGEPADHGGSDRIDAAGGISLDDARNRGNLPR